MKSTSLILIANTHMKISREYAVNARSGTRQGPARLGWLFVVAFAVLVALLGGSSRTDAAQIVALRPLAALFLIPALYYLNRDRLAAVKAPLLLLGGLALWMFIQLVPLPSGVWSALPGRGPIADMGAQLGLTDIWRPISMVPTRTLNALSSLIVPVTALWLLAVMRPRRKIIALTLIGLGAANALLGIFQVLSGESQALYFYEITNFGSAVGFFANHNHSAVFCALTLALITYCAIDPAYEMNRPLERGALAAIFLVVLIAALVGGSRAGFLTTILALSASAVMVWSGWTGQKKGSKKGSARAPVRPAVALAILALAIAGLMALFAGFDRIPALSRVTEGGTFDDLRWSLLPVLKEMIGAYWLLGAGFGSFEEVYHIHEPAALMLPSYVNQAHNDWLQLVIEGGVPAVLLLAAFLVWAARAIVTLFKGGGASLPKTIFWVAAVFIIMFASAADYPLRAPLFQMATVWLVGLLAIETGKVRGKAS